MKKPPADKQRARDDIFSSVCQDHNVTIEAIRGKDRSDAMVAARVDCVERLRIAGFGLTNIARLINRDPSTIQYHIRRTKKMSWDRRRRLPQAIYMLPKPLRDVLIDIAEKENVTAHTVMLEWLSERAQYEIEAKARAECGDTLCEPKSVGHFATMEAA